MNHLAGRRIVLGVTGGIAAYKAADLTSKLVQQGATVRVALTANATEFVGPVTFQALSGNPVYTSTFTEPAAYGMGHLALTDADAIVVAPATANLLAKAAAGLADDLLTTTLLAFDGPILLAPAMNAAMWANPLVQRNVATLHEVGYRFVGPADGWLACRREGAGRMAEVADILTALGRLLWTERDLVGRTALITAGPTREPLDAVRFLTNPSTGKQGYALVEAALMRGARVILISGPTTLPPPDGVELVPVTTAAEMAAATLARYAEADLIIACAAVGDYAFAEAAVGKPAKVAERLVTLRATPDIIAAVAERRRPGQVLVGFAAETGEAAAKAAEKLRRKGLDLIVANDVGQPGVGFGGDDNTVTLVWPDGSSEALPAQSKLAVSHAILAAAARLLPAGE